MRVSFLPTPLLAVLSGVLLLASCGTTPTTTTPTTTTPTTGTGGTTPTTPTTSPAITIARAITLGLASGPQQAELQIATTGSATIQILSAPAGLTVTAGTPARLNSGDLSLPLSYSGSVSSGSSTEVVKVGVTQNGQTTTVSIPVYSFDTTTISASGLSASYPAANLHILNDGTALLMASANGNVTERQNLLKFSPTSQQFSLLSFGLTLSGETMTSMTTSDSQLWVTVRGLSAKGSYLVAQNTGGNNQGSNTVYWAGAAGDNINNATSTADGRIWFTQYTNAAVKSLTPSTGNVQSYAVTDKADSLIRGADGKLYYAAFFTQPAIVQLDPTTGKTQTFAVGTANHSLPTALQPAPDGKIWFIEARGGTVWQLDPATGKQAALALPSGTHPNALAVGSTGQVWVMDSTSAMLYTTTTAPSTPTSTLVGLNTPALPAAPATAPDGKIWYVAGGKLVRQQ